MRHLTGILIFLLLLPLAADAQNRSGEGDVRELYDQNCAVCHGADGAGGVGIPLNLPDFLATASNEYMHTTLRQGRPGRVMPGFPALSDAEIEALKRRIEELETKLRQAGSKQDPGEPME